MSHWAATKFELLLTLLKYSISRNLKNQSNTFTIDTEHYLNNSSRVAFSALDVALSDWVRDQHSRGLVVTEENIVVNVTKLIQTVNENVLEKCHVGLNFSNRGVNPVKSDTIFVPMPPMEKVVMQMKLQLNSACHRFIKTFCQYNLTDIFNCI